MMREGERAGMRRQEKTTIVQVKGGDELPNCVSRVTVSIKHDRCERESDGNDVRHTRGFHASQHQ